MDKDNKIIHFSITVLIVICIWLCIIGSIYYVTKFFENPNSNIDYLGFIGSISGGVLTLGGVAWTINNDRKLRKEENESLYKPILVPKIVRTLENEYVIYVKLAIRNKGRAESLEFKLDEINSQFNGIDEKLIEKDGVRFIEFVYGKSNESYKNNEMKTNFKGNFKDIYNNTYGIEFTVNTYKGNIKKIYDYDFKINDLTSTTNMAYVSDIKNFKITPLN